MKKNKIIKTLFLVTGYYLLFTNYYLPITAVAQTSPDFLVSWRAINYVPADYQGKILPSKSSQVEIAFDLIDKNKMVDLSKFSVNWFLNENLLAAGTGLKTTSFTANGNLNQRIRITVSGYAPNDLDYAFTIPGSNPEVIIDTKVPLKVIQNQNWLPFQNYNFEAKPFFFNINSPGDLKFNWRLNNQLVPGAPTDAGILNLNLQSEGTPKQTQLTVSVGASNAFNQLEFAGKLINFIVK